MTIDTILAAIELGKKITLTEFERLIRRDGKLDLEQYRLAKALKIIQGVDGSPVPGSVTVHTLPRSPVRRPERDQGDGE